MSWFAVGEYKKRANMVGGKETAKPSEVGKKINALLKEYHSLERKYWKLKYNEVHVWESVSAVVPIVWGIESGQLGQQMTRKHVPGVFSRGRIAKHFSDLQICEAINL